MEADIYFKNIIMKQRIRLTESGLKKVIKESVKRVIREWDGDWSHGPYDDEDDVKCPTCGSYNTEPIDVVDTHYICNDCGEEFYLDNSWEPGFYES